MSLKLRHFPFGDEWTSSVLPLVMVVAWYMVGGLSVCSAQGDRGGIIGSVIDPTQAAVAKATVIAKSIETGYVRETRTGVDGSFLFNLLEAGRYRIEVTSQGFATLIREPITVRATETTDIQRLSLTIGVASQNVTVTGDAALLQTTSATLGKVFDDRLIEGLPLVTRNFTQLLALQPGVVADIPNAATLGNGTAGFSVGGSRYYDNSVLINGINAVGSAVLNGPLQGVAIPAPDTLLEFKVQTQLYSAEFGRAGGASVNLITKSGTNQLHGDLYEFFRNQNMNANDFFLKTSQAENGLPNRAPVLKQNQFGGTLGGPIRKDKTFFFVSYQGTRQINGAAPGVAFTNAAYPLLPSGDRSNTETLRAELGAIYGGRTGYRGASPGGGNTILPDGLNINPVAIAILQAKLPNGSYLLPSFAPSSLNDHAGGLNGGQVYSNASFSFPSKFDEDQYVIDLDHYISARQTIAGKFFSAGQTIQSPAGNVPGFVFTTLPQNTNFSLVHTFILSPTLLNEARLGYVRITNPQVRNDPVTPSDVGMTPAPGAAEHFPEIYMANAGGLQFGADNVTNTSKENMFTYSDVVSKVAGRHSMRFGATFVRHQLNTNQDVAASGQIFLYQFADFLLGQSGAQNGTGSSNLLAEFASTGSFAKDLRFNDFSVFIQDDWKVAPNFTLNLGLRWDYFGWPTDTQGRLAGFDTRLLAEGLYGIPPPGGTYSGYTIAQSYIQQHPNAAIPPGVTVVSNSLMDGNDFKNFGPRLGFAWQPVDHISIRGGYGIFYPRVSSIVALANVAGPPFNETGLNFGARGTLQDPFSVLNLPANSAFPLWQPRHYIPGVPATVSLSPTDPTSRNPYVQQRNISIQYEFAREFLLEIGYMGSNGLRLLNTRAANQPGIASVSNPIRGVTTNTAANVGDRVPVAGLTDDRGLALTQFSGASKYNALVANLNKRFSHGLQFLTAFTYGKSMDNNSLTPQGDVLNSQVPGDNTNLNHWGLSAFDRKVRSTTSFIYQFPQPFRKGSFANHVFGGWTTAGIVTFQSGTPITFLAPFAQSAVTPAIYPTPDVAPGVTLKDLQGSGPVESRLTHYFGSPGLGSPGTLFVLPGPVDFGGLGRGLAIRAPGQKSIDFTLSQRMAIREKLNLEFRAEAFNLFNWVNFGVPDSNVGDPGFGIISSTTTSARILQLALKLSF
jgi:outer membrane receptor protein involved in Fe transport